MPHRISGYPKLWHTQNKHMDNLTAGNGSFVCPLVGGGG